MKIQILVVSNDGSEQMVDVDREDSLDKVVKLYREPKNRMVCIIQDGERVRRWDRDFCSVKNNQWRKCPPDSFEILGSVEHVTRVFSCQSDQRCPK